MGVQQQAMEAVWPKYSVCPYVEDESHTYWTVNGYVDGEAPWRVSGLFLTEAEAEIERAFMAGEITREEADRLQIKLEGEIYE